MLIAYDGSEESRRALDQAAALLRPTHVELLTAWEPTHRQAARGAGATGMHQGDWTSRVENEDPAYTSALAILREGAAAAEDLGLKANAHLVESATSMWSAIVDAAYELRPDVIVCGTQATTGIRGLWRNSTAELLIKNSSCPVFVVPPADNGDRPIEEEPEQEGQAEG